VWYLITAHEYLLQKEKGGGTYKKSLVEGKVTSLSESSQGEVGDFWENLIAIKLN
jgi:hypothetical protein